MFENKECFSLRNLNEHKTVIHFSKKSFIHFIDLIYWTNQRDFQMLYLFKFEWEI